MSDLTQIPRSLGDHTIVCHFDVQDVHRHSLSLKLFCDTAYATQKVVTSFNNKLFNGKEMVELRILAPEPGGVIQVLKIGTVAGLISLGTLQATLSALETDIGKAAIMGFTGHLPAFWAEEFARSLRNKMFSDSKNDERLQKPLEFLASLPEDNASVQDALHELQAAILADATTRFLEASTKELEKFQFPTRGLKSAYSAKNRIYQACMDNPDVRAISFNRSTQFQGEKFNFSSFIAKFPRNPQRIVEKEKFETSEVAEVTKVTVNSPNWERSGRSWEGSSEKFINVEFVVDDDDFWIRVENRSIDVNIGDTMVVQWAYVPNSFEVFRVRVLKVLKFNELPLAEPLSQLELSKILR